MSRRNREKRKKAIRKGEEADPSRYYSNRRDRFYGAVFGSAVIGLISAAVVGAWSTVAVFALGYLFWFTMLFLGLDVSKKPIRPTSKAFGHGALLGSGLFVLLVGLLYAGLGF